MGVRGEVFSWRTSSTNDRRTYFFNLKENRTGDLYLTIVESKKHGEEDFERHQIQVFQEDFDKFRVGIDKVFDHIRKNNLMPARGDQPGHGRAATDHHPSREDHPRADGPDEREKRPTRRFRKRETSSGE